VFILILRPFKVGDFISAGGTLGTVNEIGLFVTTVTTLDNVRTFVGNGKILGDNIQDFTANPYRRVDLVAQLDNSVAHAEAIRLLKDRLGRIPNVVASPAPDVEILTFTPLGPVLAVRPYCHNAHYWQVYFDTNRAIREVGGTRASPRPSSTSLSGVETAGGEHAALAVLCGGQTRVPTRSHELRVAASCSATARGTGFWSSWPVPRWNRSGPPRGRRPSAIRRSGRSRTGAR
jgi:hypothetical protein